MAAKSTNNLEEMAAAAKSAAAGVTAAPPEMVVSSDEEESAASGKELHQRRAQQPQATSVQGHTTEEEQLGGRTLQSWATYIADKVLTQKPHDIDIGSAGDRHTVITDMVQLADQMLTEEPPTMLNVLRTERALFELWARGVKEQFKQKSYPDDALAKDFSVAQQTYEALTGNPRLSLPFKGIAQSVVLHRSTDPAKFLATPNNPLSKIPFSVKIGAFTIREWCDMLHQSVIWWQGSTPLRAGSPLQEMYAYALVWMCMALDNDAQVNLETLARAAHTGARVCAFLWSESRPWERVETQRRARPCVIEHTRGAATALDAFAAQPHVPLSAGAPIEGRPFTTIAGLFRAIARHYSETNHIDRKALTVAMFTISTRVSVMENPHNIKLYVDAMTGNAPPTMPATRVFVADRDMNLDRSITNLQSLRTKFGGDALVRFGAGGESSANTGNA